MSRHRPFEHGTGPGGFWFRVFGYGLHIRRSAGYQPLFSERYGFVRPLYIGPLRIEALRPDARGRA